MPQFELVSLEEAAPRKAEGPGAAITAEYVSLIRSGRQGLGR